MLTFFHIVLGWAVNIVFKNNKLRKLCSEGVAITRKWGAVQAKRLRQRLDDLHAAPNLDVMRMLPGRCHELTGTQSGQLSLDLEHPYRLVFEPANDPVPAKPDGGLDWKSVTAVRILKVEDTHG